MDSDTIEYQKIILWQEVLMASFAQNGSIAYAVIDANEAVKRFDEIFSNKLLKTDTANKN